MYKIYNWPYKLFPFLLWLPMLNRETVRADVMAGITAGVLVLPQAIALATLAGMPPEYGFYTAIFPVMIAALYGSSWHSLSGPNTALCIVMAFALSPYASEGTPDYIIYAVTLTFMVGMIQITFGLFKLGIIFNYFSYSVRVALITGVGVIIIVQQIGNFLGLTISSSEPIEDTIMQIFYNFPLSNWYAVFVGTVTVISGLVVKRWFKKWPHLIIAVVAGMLTTQLLDLLFGSATVNLDKLGNMEFSLLPFSAPDFSPENFAEAAEGLYSAAFVIAILGLMQSALINKVIAAKSGQCVNMNQEVVAQGMSNIGGSFLSCFPSCGSFNRSASNIEAGARTPLAAVISVFAVVLLVVLAKPVISEMPVTVMAGVLFLVGAGLIKFEDIKQMVKSAVEYRLFFFLCLGTTVYGGIDDGVFLGIFLSVVSYLRRTSQPEVQVFLAEEGQQYIPDNLQGKATVLEITGNIFFGSVHLIEKTLSELSQKDNYQSHLVIAGEYLQHIDMTGIEMLLPEAKKRQKNGYQVAFWLRDHRLDNMLRQSGLLAVIGEDNIHYTYGCPIVTQRQKSASSGQKT